MSSLSRFLFKKIDATGLAVFRIAYSVILYLEINDLANLSPIIYDKVPYLLKSEFNGYYAFIFWKITLILLGLGLFTRTATIVNYIFTVVIISSLNKFEYHIFYSYLGVNFLLMFIPVSRVFSLDSLLEKLKYSTVGRWYNTEKEVARISYFMPVLLGIAFIYFDSILYKLSSTMWLKGLGMWYPANLPMATWTIETFISDFEWVVKPLGYFVMVFEGLFIFLMWFKSFRIVLLLIGISFHLGILLEFPIPWFAMCYVSIYLLLVPVSWWSRIFFRFKIPVFRFYYNMESPLSIKTVVFLRHFDIFGAVDCRSIQEFGGAEPAFKSLSFDSLTAKKYGVSSNGTCFEGYDTFRKLMISMVWTAPIGFLISLPGLSFLGKRLYEKVSKVKWVNRNNSGSYNEHVAVWPPKSSHPIFINGLTGDVLTRWFWYPVLFFFIFLQVGVSVGSPFTLRVLYHLGLTDIGKEKIEYISEKFVDSGSSLWGITHHSVFSDYHFNTYDHILKVVFVDKAGIEHTLPILTDEGMPGTMISGPTWADYTFRTTGVIVSWDVYKEGVARYARLWLNNEDMNFENKTFKIYVAKITKPKNWERGFLKKAIRDLKWQEAAVLQINDIQETFLPIVPDIEIF